MKSIPCLTAAVLLLLTTTHSRAEEPKRLELRTLAAEQGAMPEWYVASGNDAFSKLTWSDRQPSDQIRMPINGAELLLYTKACDDKGGDQFTVARKLAMPADADEVLLLGWPIEGDEQAGLLAIADNRSKAEFNDWLVINHTPQEVTFHIGHHDQSPPLLPGETSLRHIDSKPDESHAVLAKAKIDDKMKTIYSTYWSAQSKQRSIVLFYSSEGRTRIQRIIDVLPVDDKTPR